MSRQFVPSAPSDPDAISKDRGSPSPKYHNFKKCRYRTLVVFKCLMIIAIVFIIAFVVYNRESVETLKKIYGRNSMFFDVNMGDKSKYDDCHIHFPARNSGGRDKFYNHKSDQDDHDADFEITLTIQKLWKQVKEDDVNSIRSNNSQSVVQGQESLGEAVKNLLDKMGANPAKMDAEQDGIWVIDRANA